MLDVVIISKQELRSRSGRNARKTNYFTECTENIQLSGFLSVIFSSFCMHIFRSKFTVQYGDPQNLNCNLIAIND